MTSAVVLSCWIHDEFLKYWSKERNWNGKEERFVCISETEMSPRTEPQVNHNHLYSEQMAVVSPGRLLKKSFTRNCSAKNQAEKNTSQKRARPFCQNYFAFLQFGFTLLFQIDKHFSKSFKLQKYFLQQNMQVGAGWNNDSANKLNLKKIGF